MWFIFMRVKAHQGVPSWFLGAFVFSSGLCLARTAFFAFCLYFAQKFPLWTFVFCVDGLDGVVKINPCSKREKYEVFHICLFSSSSHFMHIFQVQNCFISSLVSGNMPLFQDFLRYWYLFLMNLFERMTEIEGRTPRELPSASLFPKWQQPGTGISWT